MTRIIDGDGHFVEPFDLWERYIEPAYRDRCLRFDINDTRTEIDMFIEGQPVPPSMKLPTLQLFGLATGYGQKENEGRGLGELDTSPLFDGSMEDMDARLRFLDDEGFDM